MIVSDLFWLEILNPALKLSKVYLTTGFSDLIFLDNLPEIFIVDDCDKIESGAVLSVRISVPGKNLGVLVELLYDIIKGNEIPKSDGNKVPNFRLLVNERFSLELFVPILSWSTWKSASFLL